MVCNQIQEIYVRFVVGPSGLFCNLNGCFLDDLEVSISHADHMQKQQLTFAHRPFLIPDVKYTSSLRPVINRSYGAMVAYLSKIRNETVTSLSLQDISLLCGQEPRHAGRLPNHTKPNVGILGACPFRHDFDVDDRRSTFDS